MSGGALYVYAIIPAGDGDSWVDGLTGIDGRQVQVVATATGVAALVHDADPIPYQGPDDDVRRWVLEHSAVVERAWEAAGTVLPVTFNVIVRPEDDVPAADRLGDWLSMESETMREALDRLRGTQELRVEIALDRPSASAADPELRSLRAEIESKPRGMRRLLEKKAEQIERQAADRLADRLYPEYRRRIAAHVEDLVEQRRSSAPAGSVAVLSAAVLVRSAAADALGTELARIQEEQPAARIRYLGPWPPYSFAQTPAAGSALEHGRNGQPSVGNDGYVM